MGVVLVLSALGASVQAIQSVTLGWEPSPSTNAVGYFRYFGTTSGIYINKADVGSVTNATISGLVEGWTYFFVVTAYDAAGRESVPSNEVSYTVPTSDTPPAVGLSSPLSGAGYAAPATINLTASVTANGHAITKVRFYNSTTLLGEDTSAPYSLVWSNVGIGSYSLTARAVYDAGSIVTSSPVNFNVMGLPAPWRTTDVGSVGVAGSATVSNGIYIVKGAGTISSTADNFRFVYQTLSGDGEIKVRLSSAANTSTAARIGVMIRESLTSDAKCAFMGISPDGTFRWQRRSTTAANTASTTSGIGTPPNVWVRLVRTGGTLYGYKSTDGVNWTLVNSRSITMATNIYVGLAVASGSSSTLNTSAFANVTVVP
jgi:regulation of enolase protein 1 (concanavalin A-like superfamily)